MTALENLKTPEETAALLRIKPATLHAWRMRGRGPRFIRMNARLVRYPMAEIEAWVERSTVAPKRNAEAVASPGV